ncbi:Re/Si-specific NAD(P)(+) transhydrogenase subunit alpha [Liberiplasma polymorphum]|uniref:Re/Si-specific NAD(P)(+) transhydrogenase subunit alpha n=1 Tax=Liberiplasma polymorphum TaxID=3374570 RepID=UPI003770D441
MIIGIPKEQTSHETRVALVPMHVPLLTKKGFEVILEKGAGVSAGYLDDEYTDKGAKIVNDIETLTKKAQIILTVRSAAAASNGEALAKLLSKDHILVGMLEPYAPHASFDALLEQKVTSFSMELIPRTTRAQSMDVLSSMANLAGYKSVIIGAEASPKMFPMMMTAAGTIVPAKVFVLGVGVAGLQAIATAKRLGAVTSAYDVRPVVKEQVLSLGAKFIEFDLETGEGEGGYAKVMDDAFYKKQREMMKDVLKNMDVVITTANIPGKKAPILLTKEMVHAMPKGSVIVDLAAERGGNCELTKLGKVVNEVGVKIIGPENIPSTLAFNASALYSKNIQSFIDNMFTKELTINFEDDIVSATLVTKEGAIVHPNAKEWIGGKTA